MFDFHVTKSQGSGATIAQLMEEWYDVTTVLFGSDVLVVLTVGEGGILENYLHSMNGEPLAKDGKFVGYEVKP